MKSRRLVSALHAVERQQHDLEGEVLPPVSDGAIVPSQPARPVISIKLPRAPEDDSGEDAPTAEYERRRAQRPVTWESDVRVPAAQAALTALAFGLTAALLAWAFSWSWRVPVVIMALTLAGAWLWRLRLVDGLLWEIETLTGRDMNRDGRIGRPSAGYTVANPHKARQTARRSARDSEAERQRAALVAFVHRCYRAGTSEAAHSVKATGPDREAYVRARDALLSLGIAEWRNPERPRAGWRMVVTEAEALALISEHVL